MVDIENVHRKLLLSTGTDTPPLFQQECVTENASDNIDNDENIEEVDQNAIYEYPVEDVPDEENPTEENPVDNNHNTFDQEPLDKIPTQEKLPQTIPVPPRDPVYADDETDEEWLRDDIFVKKDRKDKRELKVAKKNADSQRNNLFGKHIDMKTKKPLPPKRSSDRDHCKCDDIRTDPKLKTKVCSLM
uniref:BLVR domain-containing protein n=1 Tax=Heterorhabditis bacteriophora TaxID=37862 RepID=A0A1I7X9Q4_HETBA